MCVYISGNQSDQALNNIKVEVGMMSWMPNMKISGSLSDFMNLTMKQKIAVVMFLIVLLAFLFGMFYLISKLYLKCFKS